VVGRHAGDTIDDGGSGGDGGNFRDDEEFERVAILSVLDSPFRIVNDEVLFGDPIILFRRFLITFFSVLITNPIPRLCLVWPFLLSFIHMQHTINPYRLDVLNVFELVSLTFLSVFLSFNMFRAFLFVYGLQLHHPIDTLLAVMDWIEYLILISPMIILILFVTGRCLHKLCLSCKRRLRRDPMEPNK